MINITKAEVEHSKELSELYKYAWGENYTYKELLDEDLIKTEILSDNHIWYVAIINNKVVGTMIACLNKWNMTYEGGRTVVLPEFRRNKIPMRLFEKIKDDAFNFGYDLLYYTMRDFVGIKAADKSRMNLVLCGHIPGKHYTQFRENQLFYIDVSRNLINQRNQCQNSKYYENSIVKQILEKLKLRNNSGIYPTENIYGNINDSKLFKFNSSNIHYVYNKEDNSVTIVKITGEQIIDAISNIIYEKENIPKELEYPSYIELDVLIHNTDLIKSLIDIGFEMCVFLPGWCLKNNMRYDCLRLVYREPFSKDIHVEKSVRFLIKEFNKVV